MAGTTITIEGVLVTDVTPYRNRLATVRAKLKAIYAGFDPARPEQLFAREAEIVELANDAERQREIVERWEEAEAKSATILEVWTLVKTFDEDGA